MLAGDPIVLGHGPRWWFRRGRVLLGIFVFITAATTATTAVVGGGVVVALLGHGSGFFGCGLLRPFFFFSPCENQKKK